MTAQTILKMIEEVDPADTAKLDELDARVAEYLGVFSYWKSKHEHYNIDFKNGECSASFPGHGAYQGYCPDTGKKRRFPDQFPYAAFLHWYGNIRLYTRSRDALKAIRPEGWKINLSHHRNDFTVFFELFKGEGNPSVHLYKGSTEELAELHAIIQAIDYERGRE